MLSLPIPIEIPAYIFRIICEITSGTPDTEIYLQMPAYLYMAMFTECGLRLLYHILFKKAASTLRAILVRGRYNAIIAYIADVFIQNLRSE